MDLIRSMVITVDKSTLGLMKAAKLVLGSKHFSGLHFRRFYCKKCIQLDYSVAFGSVKINGARRPFKSLVFFFGQVLYRRLRLQKIRCTRLFVPFQGAQVPSF